MFLECLHQNMQDSVINSYFRRCCYAPFKQIRPFCICRTMSNIFKLVVSRDEEAETVQQSTSAQPATETGHFASYAKK